MYCLPLEGFLRPPEGFLLFSVTVVDGCAFAYFSVTKRPVFADLLFSTTALDFFAIISKNLLKKTNKEENNGK